MFDFNKDDDSIPRPHFEVEEGACELWQPLSDGAANPVAWDADAADTGVDDGPTKAGTGTFQSFGIMTTQVRLRTAQARLGRRSPANTACCRRQRQSARWRPLQRAARARQRPPAERLSRRAAGG